jgi:hypothetical protein
MEFVEDHGIELDEMTTTDYTIIHITTVCTIHIHEL